ncbi:MMPL family transporter [Streptomyces piniterrae]|uniref:MMPL family transporter n=1 Tax=Streptomyces piniterrae TaxID=2571125 RepID=A0A4U0NWP2_9ACTN|nr:MMPL family transporter [Streptomyces piniterrae]TJZ59226.1 MMPL family transporter [Streptomyces piniterrae]
MLRRLGTLIARRARTVLVVAGLITLVAGGVGASVFGHLKAGGFQDPAAPSSKAAKLLDTEFGGTTGLVFLVHPRHGGVDSPAARAAGRNLTDRITHHPGVEDVVSYWRTPDDRLKAHDGRSALVLVRFAEDQEQAARRAAELLSEDVAGKAAGPEVKVLAGGPRGIDHDVTTQVAKDLGLAEGIAVPITLVLLIVVFRGLVPALIPLAIGGAAILGTFAELRVLAAVTDVSVFALNLTTALGLGLAIDYGLLMISRFRERMATTQDIAEAVAHTVATAGRTILFSAATVIAALSTLLLFPLYFLRSFAYAGLGVVATAALAALFVTPALLTVCGHRVASAKARGRRGARVAGRHSATGGAWHTIARTVFRRPFLSAVPAAVLLALAAAPLLDARFGLPDERVLPTTSPSRAAATALHKDFPHFSGAGTLDIVLTGSASPRSVAGYARTLSKLPGVTSVDPGTAPSRAGSPAASPTTRKPAGDLRRLTVRTGHSSASAAAQRLVGRIRAVEAPGHSTALVGGAAAQAVDTKQAIRQRLPLVIAMIAVSTFLLLFLFTGSVIQPLRALALNTLGLGAILGTLVWIFQEGHFSSLLGFTPMPMDTAMTLLMCCLVFGLSTDYEVFVLGRIKELHDQGLPAAEAVPRGLAHTGALVSAAAALLAVSLLAFTTSSVSFMQMFGLGSGLAILVDATVIRGVLLPAFLRLLGERAWYCPRWLRRLHTRFGLTD